MCIQHHVVRFPIHLYRLDLTIRGRTWDPHEVLLEDDPMLKKFKMALKSFSFMYNNFSTLNGLICVGNVELSSHNSAYKINSNKNDRKSGALWHSLK